MVLFAELQLAGTVHEVPLVSTTRTTPTAQTPFQHSAPATHTVLSVQLVGHAAERPLHRYGAHDGLPAPPAGTLVQVPSVPLRLHALHAPAQAPLQQVPSTQFPLVHSPPLVHVTPFACFIVQAVPLQKYPATHCPSSVQLVGHAAATPLHRYGAHGGLPAPPMGTFVQVPSCPLRLHASHPPPQALSQQRPSAQLPLVHWPTLVQVAPFASFGTHAVPLQ
jgi:hypothetical protein